MCGIAGLIAWDAHAQGQREEVLKMTRAIAHRGPDGEGVLVRDGVAFGHRRLSIIDLESGAQPMTSADGETWITYNGEVYNYRELRNELAAKGYRFHTTSDTEVVLYAFKEWGSCAVARLRGMFAFAAVDFRTRRGLLARDTFGIKPLVYAHGPKRLAFASELQALTQLRDRSECIDLRAVELYLRFQFIPPPFTIYEGVRKLGPGEFIEFDLDGRVSAPRRHFTPSFAPQPRTEADALDAFEAVVRESVHAHLVADVPYGVLLSGGVDSSLIAITVARESGARLPAFVIDTGPESSEVRYAREVADAYGLELVVEPIGELSLSLLPTLVRHFGEPFADSSALPTWYVARLGRSRVPLVLSGDGGDEFFAGYHSYESWLHHVPRLRQSVGRAVLAPGADSIRAAVAAAAWRFGGRRSNLLPEWVSRIRASGDMTRYRLWRAPYRQLSWMPSPAHERAARDARGSDALAYAQLLDIETYLPGDILAKVDITSMAHGLEVRPPLIDPNVFAFARSLPVELRIKHLSSSELVKKYLPKALLHRAMPAEFVHRRKQGFAVPLAEWFRHGRTAQRELADVLAAPDPRLLELFNLQRVREALNRHAAGENHALFLWAMLVFSTWLKHHQFARVPERREDLFADAANAT